MAWMMVGAGVLSGLLSAGVLALVNEALHQSGQPSTLLGLAFVALVVGKISTNVLSQLLLVRFSQDTVLDLSLTLCSKITRASFRRSEARGPANILVTLTDDVGSVTWAIQCFPQLAMNIAVVIGCGAYLAWLSWQTFVGVVVVTILGALGYHGLHRSAMRFVIAAREARAELFRHFRTLTEGLKELLMHRARRREFVQDVMRRAAEQYREINLRATQRYTLAEAWTQLSFYVLVGLLIFAFPRAVAVSTEAVTGYVFAVLYMMNPIWSIIGALPAVGRGQVALNNIERLGVSLDDDDRRAAEQVAGAPSAARTAAIQLDQVSFTYDAVQPDEDAFTLGPLTLTMKPGQLVFVIGGNGSGKSTFVKVLTGLYGPQAGRLTLGGVPVTEANREWYREHFSVVFSDFHVFDRLLGIADATASSLASTYLSLLQIDQKVSLNGRRFSTVELSQGQRKRLALVTAYLEDRPVYVFDEWAADQDPHYKEVFYRTLLPDLRARGKLVIVITHDDRYFHLGDQVVKLEDGKVVEPTQTESRGGQRMSLLP